MKTDFLNKVVKEHYLDTKKYRYMAIEKTVYYDIVRLPLKQLGTVKAYEEWEHVTYFIPLNFNK